ncbi:proteolipid protein 2 isoform X1 [Saccopteryx bilineata]|uniref:proteolipid protein 2 isoform X1 n=1 Tax=Saccopteryx bilineata TaxID=59482 RepID=UPI00338F4758
MADSERFSAPGCWAAFTNFARTCKGILLLAEIVRVPGLAGGQRRGGAAGSRGPGRPRVRQILCLVILICFIASTSAYFSLSVVEMVLAAVYFVIYMFDLNTRININWPWSDFLRTLIATILYLIISIIVLVEKGNHSKIVAGVMGLIAACLFGYDAYFTFPLRQQRHTAAPTDTADGPV